MKKIVSFLLFIFVLSNAFFCKAQNQWPDKFIYNETSYSLNYNPLEDYFTKNPDKKPKTNSLIMSLWRGYIATFEFSDNQLYLKNIEVPEMDTLNKPKKLDSIFFKNLKFEQRIPKFKNVNDKIFPGKQKIKIDWLTHLLVVPYGQKVSNDNIGNSVYENYLLFEIHKGRLIKKLDLSLEEFKKFKILQYESFKKSSGYKKTKRKLIKRYKNLIDPEICGGINNCVDMFVEGLISENITNYTTKILTNQSSK